MPMDSARRRGRVFRRRIHRISLAHATRARARRVALHEARHRPHEHAVKSLRRARAVLTRSPPRADPEGGPPPVASGCRQNRQARVSTTFSRYKRCVRRVSAGEEQRGTEERRPGRSQRPQTDVRAAAGVVPTLAAVRRAGRPRSPYRASRRGPRRAAPGRRGASRRRRTPARRAARSAARVRCWRRAPGSPRTGGRARPPWWPRRGAARLRCHRAGIQPRP